MFRLRSRYFLVRVLHRHRRRLFSSFFATSYTKVLGLVQGHPLLIAGSPISAFGWKEYFYPGPLFLFLHSRSFSILVVSASRQEPSAHQHAGN